jgi:hypothetical protein
MDHVAFWKTFYGLDVAMLVYFMSGSLGKSQKSSSHSPENVVMDYFGFASPRHHACLAFFVLPKTLILLRPFPMLLFSILNKNAIECFFHCSLS